MSSDATTEATLPGAAEPAPADLPPAESLPAAPPTAAPPRTLVVGLGNPAPRRRRRRLAGGRRASRRGSAGEPRRGGRPSPTSTSNGSPSAACALMERLVGYERAILVDAITTGVDPPGTVRVAPLAEVATRAASHLDSAHDAPLTTALAAGRSLGRRPAGRRSSSSTDRGRAPRHLRRGSCRRPSRPPSGRPPTRCWRRSATRRGTDGRA